jgi:hypothetical protein
MFAPTITNGEGEFSRSVLGRKGGSNECRCPRGNQSEPSNARLSNYQCYYYHYYLQPSYTIKNATDESASHGHQLNQSKLEARFTNEGGGGGGGSSEAFPAGKEAQRMQMGVREFKRLTKEKEVLAMLTWSFQIIPRLRRFQRSDSAVLMGFSGRKEGCNEEARRYD